MIRWITLASIAILVAVLVSLAWRDSEDGSDVPTATVSALRYRIVWADSALDLTHGGGRWVEELYFPQSRVTATIVFESYEADWERPEFTTRPRVYVGRADGPRTNLTGLSDAPPAPPREIRVSAKLARALEALADLHDEHENKSLDLGRKLGTALELEEDAGAMATPSPSR